jgi:hypothetical protein
MTAVFSYGYKLRDIYIFKIKKKQGAVIVSSHKVRHVQSYYFSPSVSLELLLH